MEQTPNYPIEIFWSDEDECWVAVIRDLGVAVGFGSTAEDALRDLRVSEERAIHSFVERGLPLPEPRESEPVEG